MEPAPPKISPGPSDLSLVPAEADPPRVRHVVGIGASAGGLQPLEQFFENVAVDTGMAFVVVQHLSPDFRSLMDELLGRRTALPVKVIADGDRLAPDTVHLLPAQHDLEIVDGRLRLAPFDAEERIHLPIDGFFSSLAALGPRAVAVILSGSGSDGSRGVRAVHAAGGLVMVQDEQSAQFDGMPRAALATGAVDLVLAPEAMPAALRRHFGDGALPSVGANGDSGTVEQIFELLRERFDLDFVHYKPSTVQRRFERRLVARGRQSLESYLELLRDDPGELEDLYLDLLIGVTSFFRDEEIFESLAATVLPDLLAERRGAEPLRVWVPACASGEEVYSIAMLFFEAFAENDLAPRLKIFATDVHRGALETASRGIYPAAALENVSAARRERFFEAQDGSLFKVVPSLRESIIFAPHNVLHDPPFHRLDFLSCRNLLIYFQPMAQRRVLTLFHHALRTGGVLLLGKSETVGTLDTELEPIDRPFRLFRKRRELALSVPMHQVREVVTVPRFSGVVEGDRRRAFDAVKDHLLQLFLPPSVLLDEKREIVYVFGDLGDLLGPRPGRGSRDLLDLVPAGQLRIALSGALHRVAQTQAPVTYGRVHVRGRVSGNGDGTGSGDGPGSGGVDDRREAVRLVARPLEDPRSRQRFVLVSFHPVEPAPADAEEAVTKLDGEGEPYRRIDHLESELRYTREHLQSTIEELETSNEELQSTNEELVAGNEELQSTNEELHSVNEELYTVNLEHQAKIDELVELHRDVENLLAATDIGTVFLDADLRVRKFTPSAETAFHLLERDIGRPIEHIVQRFEMDDLSAHLRRVVDGETFERRVVSVDRDESMLLRALPYRSDGENDGVVLTFVDVSELEQARENLHDAEDRLGRSRQLNRAVLDALDAHIAVLDPAGKIRAVNDRWLDFARRNGGDTESIGPGADYLGACRRAAEAGDSVAGEVAAALERVLGGSGETFSVEYPCHSPDERRWFAMQASPLAPEVGGAVVSHFDISARIFAEEREESRIRELERLRQAFEQEREEAESGLRAIEAKMLQAQKLESLGVLAGGIAHDFNNLLASIAANTQVIRAQQRAGGLGEGEKQLARIEEATIQATELCRQMLAYAGRGRVQKELLDLRRIFQETLALVEHSISKDAALEISVPPRLPRVEGDRSQLRQIVMNLLTNASEALVDGRGRIRVEMTVEHLDEDDLEPLLPPSNGARPGEYVMLRIEDDGCGMESGTLERIFDPFFTTKRFRGRGMGLAAVLGIARSHGGAIGVESDPSRGTEFRFYLPAVDGEVEKSLGRSSREEWRGTGTILVVDDEEHVREAIGDLLEILGFSVHLAASGVEAVETMAARRLSPDLILLDWTMPVMGGGQTSKRLHEIVPEVPIVAMSGYTEWEVRANEREELAGFLPKPFEPAELTAILRRLLESSESEEPPE